MMENRNKKDNMKDKLQRIVLATKNKDLERIFQKTIFLKNVKLQRKQKSNLVQEKQAGSYFIFL